MRRQISTLSLTSSSLQTISKHRHLTQNPLKLETAQLKISAWMNLQRTSIAVTRGIRFCVQISKMKTWSSMPTLAACTPRISSLKPFNVSIRRNRIQLYASLKKKSMNMWRILRFSSGWLNKTLIFQSTTRNQYSRLRSGSMHNSWTPISHSSSTTIWGWTRCT